VLRDRNLVLLSHQHQHVLALCVRLDRALQAGPVDLESWQAEIQAAFEEEICIHFAAEEKVLFPVAERIPDLRPTIEELRAEHQLLRDIFKQASERQLGAGKLAEFVHTLAHHIRKEERQLFEGMQGFMTPEELSALGTALGEELAAVPKQCSLRRPKPSQD
jgi:hemerythrin-like domain-containing protein